MKGGFKMASADRIAVHLLALFLLVSGLQAATFYVDRHDDVASADDCDPLTLNDCSLRGAIRKANSTAVLDTVRLGTGTYDLTIAGAGEDNALTGDLDLLEEVVISGRGAGVTLVEAHIVDRVFDVRPDAVVTLQDLTIQNGNAADASPGGGIRSWGAETLIDRCHIDQNQTSHAGGGVALLGTGSMVIRDSEITNNTAGEIGGGGIYANSPGGATLEVVGSTISANATTQGGGGGIKVWNANALIRNSTISANSIATGNGDALSAVLGAGVTLSAVTVVDSGDPGIWVENATLNLINTLIASTCEIYSGGGTIQTFNGNLESPGATCGLGAGDLENVLFLNISALGKWGGGTRTHRPEADSPAVDFAQADHLCETTDQRGIARPQDAGTPGTAHCDIGAVELVRNEIFLDGFEGGTPGGWSSSSP